MPLFFRFDLFLEARPEILTNILLFFWERFEDAKRTFWKYIFNWLLVSGRARSCNCAYAAKNTTILFTPYAYMCVECRCDANDTVKVFLSLEMHHFSIYSHACGATRYNMEKKFQKENLKILTFIYRKVPSSSMSRLVVHFQIFRRLMKGKFDAYVLWPLAKKLQNWTVQYLRMYRISLLKGSFKSCVWE